MLLKPLESTESLVIGGNSEAANPSSTRGKHCSRGKEREHASVGKNVEKIEEKVPKDKQKTIHCHWKNKARQRADQGLNVVAQTPVIPDLLL